MSNKILFISSTHGNENFSIPVFEELERDYPRESFGYDWIVGNPKAVEANVRFVDADLNRSAPGNPDSKAYEERLAAELVELSRNYTMVIDIHGTRSDFGIVKIIPYPSFSNLVLAGMFPAKRNVIWYSKSSEKKGPLVQFMHCPAIELECGDKNDPKTALELKKMLVSFLEGLQNGSSILSQLSKQELYSVYDKESDDTIERKDFEVTTKDGETFYSFLAKNGYANVSYYKMHKVELEELFG